MAERPRIGMALVALLAVLLTGCGNSTGAGMEKTITIEEANRKVKDYLTNSLAALPPDMEHRVQFKQEEASCAKSGTATASGLVRAALDYQLLNLEKKRIPEYFGMMRQWWESHDYRVLEDTPTNEYLWVEHNPDGFRMALQANDLGEMYLTSASPCVWPNGTPEPEE